jgi:hypothetical protein
MRDEPDDYLAYLLRLWRVRYQGRWQWRASIDSPHTGERRSFGTLAGLLTFLEDKTRQEGPRGAKSTDRTLDGSSVSCEEERHDA